MTNENKIFNNQQELLEWYLNKHAEENPTFKHKYNEEILKTRPIKNCYQWISKIMYNLIGGSQRGIMVNDESIYELAKSYYNDEIDDNDTNIEHLYALNNVIMANVDAFIKDKSNLSKKEKTSVSEPKNSVDEIVETKPIVQKVVKPKKKQNDNVEQLSLMLDFGD